MWKSAQVFVGVNKKHCLTVSLFIACAVAALVEFTHHKK